jgi:hypothetical protein
MVWWVALIVFIILIAAVVVISTATHAPLPCVDLTGGC